jgi:hypothetical protein
MRAVVWSFCVAVLGGAVAAGVAAFFTGRHALVLDLYLLFLGGVTLLALVRMTRVAQPGSAGSPFETALRESRSRAQRPPDLVRLEQHLTLAATTAFDVHYRLRPVIREIARQRLWAKHAIDLENDPKRAETLLPARTWDLVRPDRPSPADRFARGPGLLGVEAVVAELERS